MAPPVDLSGLQTEGRNSRTRNIDTVSALELCQILHREDSTIPAAVEPCLPVIAEVIDTLAERVQRGGRVFYIGAGTSGRLGVLDASEIPPTYSAPAGQFVALIAGGDYALRNAIEGAEDDVAQAQKDLGEFNINPEVDSLIGIASSGRTPYVLGGLAWAKSIGCTTVGVVCAHPSAIGDEGNADFVIAAVTGPESVTGSTRMKAGTATKLVLNMISTGIMIRTGKTYGNLMVDLKASNLKLKQRARNILRAIDTKAIALTNDELDASLEACGGSTKLAAVSIVLGVSAEEAEGRLKSNGGILAKVFEEYRGSETKSDVDEGLALCVDAGGTSCTAVVLSKDGTSGRGAAGPCNISSNGIDAAIGSIASAVQAAVDDCELTKGRTFQSIRFADAWIGIAGYDRPSLVTATTEVINNMFHLQSDEKPTITTDIDLLPAKLNANAKIDSAIVLVAGTGSIAMQYQRQDSRFIRTGRLGGWGHLLGDDGSGYGIGREGLRRALRQVDAANLALDSEGVPTYSALTSAIVNHFQAQFPSSSPRDLLSTVIAPEEKAQNSGDALADKTSRIAGTAKIILDLAETDDEAREIVHHGAQQLADLVTLLVQTRKVAVVKTGLILSGGLMHNDVYRQRVTALIESAIGAFGHVEVIDNPAEDAAKSLLFN